MPLSRYIETSNLARPGVCTSTTRPASPYEGMVIYESDTDKLLFWNGASWYAPWDVAWGVVGAQTLNTGQGTSGTHTTLQDTGATLTINEVNGRTYKVTYSTSAYPNAGVQGMVYEFNRAGALLWKVEIPSGSLSTFNACSQTWCVYYTATSSASVTYKMQFRALTSNTQVTDYGASGQARMFWIEDMGVL